MAQPGNFTPLLIYGSSTPTNVPLAANLTNSTNGAELAINIADKNLFFKDSGGTVNTVPIRQSGTSSNGWLSATDWNTFNNKAPATSGTSLLYGNGSGGFSNVTIGSGISFAGGTLSATGSGGTVTSVTGTSPVVSSGGTTPAISLATAYGDTLNPYASKTANYFLSAPNGSAGVPTFRAIVAADLPSLSSVYIPYTGASSAVDLNAQTLTNIAHLGLNSTAVPDILLRAYGDNNSTSRIAIRGYSSNASSSSMRVAKFRGTFASPQAPLSGDSLGKFELAGYGTTSSSGYPQASYEGVATENWGATARGTKALFYVTPNTTITQAVALTLDQDKSATFASSVTATLFSGSGANLTSIPNSALVNSTISGVALGSSLFNLTAGTGVSFSAGTTYNGSAAITINATGSGGTVTSVAALTLGTTGTDLSSTVANGTTTPVITLNVPTASATNRGALSAADWTTFNNKQPAGTYVTSVTGTSPIVSSGGTTPAISMPAATTSVSGYLSSTDWNTFNGKAPAFTYTTGYIPFGQNTTTPNQSGNLFWDNANARLGVGTASPANSLNIVADNTPARGQLSLQTVSASNFAQISFYDRTTLSAQIYQEYGGSVLNILTSVSSPISFGTNGTERMRLPAAGGVQAVTTISVGNATPSASGAGITFPATQSASSNVNTLDDYEEGTWTPTGNGVTFTAGTTGWYTKVGNLVTLNFIVNWPVTANGSPAYITNLPFTTNTNAGVALGGYTTDLNMITLVGNTILYPTNLAATVVTVNATLSGKSIVGCVSYMT